MKLKHALFCTFLLLPCLSAAGCSSGEADALAEPELVGETSLEIQPDDKNRCCFPQIDSVVACDARDGVFERTSGMCTIIVDQECNLVTAPNGEVGCCCKVKVLDTMAGCDNKDWDDFYGKCQQ